MTSWIRRFGITLAASVLLCSLSAAVGRRRVRSTAGGPNGSGQLNVPAPNSNFVAVSAGGGAGAGGDHSLGLKADGSIVGWGDNTYGQCTVPGPNTGFIAVSAGGTIQPGAQVGRQHRGVGGQRVRTDQRARPEQRLRGRGGGRGTGSDWGMGLKADGSVVAWGTTAATS